MNSHRFAHRATKTGRQFRRLLSSGFSHPLLIEKPETPHQCYRLCSKNGNGLATTTVDCQLGPPATAVRDAAWAGLLQDSQKRPGSRTETMNPHRWLHPRPWLYDIATEIEV
ncbi:hypothetical protein [Novipirellula artificiosorum]|uniref:hypothetical protein n=1 Tax=Novipirellula artificiosorum TaxID=2528016 RepID=UPI0011B4F072|nr:hypothetical protein [Novipirellula artificiosorum]